MMGELPAAATEVKRYREFEMKTLMFKAMGMSAIAALLASAGHAAAVLDRPAWA